MPDSYYPNTDSEDAADESDPNDEKESSDSKDSPSKETTLIPASFFGDKEKEVGDECKIRIVAIHDGEIEAEYVKHDDSKDSAEDSDEGDMSPTEAMTGTKPPPRKMSLGGY